MHAANSRPLILTSDMPAAFPSQALRPTNGPQGRRGCAAGCAVEYIDKDGEIVALCADWMWYKEVVASIRVH
jgi:hypothetical protein